jgi:hypothetical protein
VVIVAGYVNVMPYYLIVDNSINSPADLKGKVGANHMPGTAADTVIRIGLKALGLDPDRDVSLPRDRQHADAFAGECRRASPSSWSLRIWSLCKAKRLGFKLLVDYVAAKTPFPMGGAVTTERYVKEKRDVVLRYVKALAQALHYLKTNREGSLKIISRYARFQNVEVMGAAFDSPGVSTARFLCRPTEGFDLVAKELAQRNPKLRDFDTRSVVDLQFHQGARAKRLSEKRKGEISPRNRSHCSPV